MGRIRELWRRCDGGVLVETALVWPMLLMMLFGLVEYGRFAWTQVTLNYAVQEAARCAAVTGGTCGDAEAIKAYARTRAAPADVPTSAFTVTTPACGVQVEAAYAYPVTVGAIAFPEAPVIRARACRPIGA
jgi:hypothetical protein